MGSGRKEPELLEIPGAEGESVEFFSDLMHKTLRGQNIPLEGTAGLSTNEQMVQNLLGGYLGKDTTGGEAYQLGMGELKKTLGEEFYDPKTSDFWKGFRDVSKMEQEEGVADIRRRGQIGGGLFSTGVAREEIGYQARKEAERTGMLGGLYERERDRKISAVGQALGYAGFEKESTESKLKFGATLGQIPRTVEQGKLSRQYVQTLGQERADYATQLNQISMQSGAASELMPQWNIDQGSQASPLGGILGLAAAIIGK